MCLAGYDHPQRPNTRYLPTDNVTSQLTLPGFRGSQFPGVAAHRLPTNTTANRHAVHRWFNFVAGFAPEFVAQHCPRDGGPVLDPFTGCGTTLVVARSLGHPTIGFEPHPFFARIARAKIAADPSESRLNAIEQVLLGGAVAAGPIPVLSDTARSFLAKLFEARTLRQLLRARLALETAGMEDDDVAFLLLSRVLDMCSTSKTDGIYKAPTSRKRPADPLSAIQYVVGEIRRDLTFTRSGEALPDAQVHLTSSEDMGAVPDEAIAAVITSPPYLNNFDFAEMTRMYLYFWGICGSWREITEKVRSRLIVNTTTALTGRRVNQATDRTSVPQSLHPRLDEIVHRLAMERRRRPGKKEYDRLVFPYFAAVARILRESFRCLAPGAKAHVVVADAALYGVHISTPQLLGDVMREVGYRSVQCVKLRDRGQRWILKKRDGSPIGLGEYHLSATRNGAD